MPNGDPRAPDGLEQALERISDGVLAFDRGWRLTYLNGAAERYFGRARETLLGKVLWEEVPEMAGSELEDAHRRAAEMRAVVEVEIQAPATRRWVVFSVNPSDSGVSVVFRDITERKQAEEALRASEAKYHSIVEHSAEGILLTRQEGETLAANPAACRMLGRTEEEVVRAGRAGITDTQDPRLPAFLEERRRAGSARAELSLVRKDGSTFPVEVSSAIFVDTDGSRKTSLSFRDLTASKRAEDRVRLIAEAGTVLGATLETEATLQDLARLVVPRLGDYCLVDLVEEGGLRRAAASHCEAAREAALTAVRAPSPILHKEVGVYHVARTGTQELVRQVDDAWLRAATRDEAHFQIVRAMAPRSLVMVPLVGKGVVLGVLTLASVDGARLYDESDLAVARAIADRAALAIENARLYEQAVQARRLRDEVLGIVSHDLSNPLNTIVLSARTMQRVSDAPELRAIDRAASHADALIQDLLMVAALEGGALPLFKQPEPVKDLFDEALLLHRTPAAAASVNLEGMVAEGLPAVVVDRHRILQGIANLLGNAIKFTPPGGRVRLDVQASGSDLVVSVANEGAGIEAEDLGRVFDWFWQGARTRRTGVGLGLSIARGIVLAHGGTMRAESTPGEWTTFTFTLPLERVSG